MGRSANFSVIVLIIGGCILSSIANDDDKFKAVMEENLVDQIIDNIDHIKEDDLVVPVDEVSDSMPIPDMKHRSSIAIMNFSNMSVYGLKKFRIIDSKLEISNMQANASLNFDVIDLKGNCTSATWISRTTGPFAVHLTDVKVRGIATLAVEGDGKLRVQDIKIDITSEQLIMKFENLGFLRDMFRVISKSVESFLFDSIKAFMLKEVKPIFIESFNKNLEKVTVDMEFPNLLEYV